MNPAALCWAPLLDPGTETSLLRSCERLFSPFVCNERQLAPPAHRDLLKLTQRSSRRYCSKTALVVQGARNEVSAAKCALMVRAGKPSEPGDAN